MILITILLYPLLVLGVNVGFAHLPELALLWSVLVGGVFLVRDYLMPVLQGYTREDYLRHIDQYDGRLAHGAWVGVGSVCKRNGAPEIIFRALLEIKCRRPDLRLHGFGLKTTALACRAIRRQLHSADSMAWSFAARRQGRNRNDWREAQSFRDQIMQMDADDRLREQQQQALL